MFADVGKLRVDRAEATATRAIAGRIDILIKLCRPFFDARESTRSKVTEIDEDTTSQVRSPEVISARCERYTILPIS